MSGRPAPSAPSVRKAWLMHSTYPDARRVTGHGGPQAAPHKECGMTEPHLDLWQVGRLDLDGYLARVGQDALPPSRAALDALHEAHVRTFTFDNVDVLLDQHPGVGLEQVQGKFVGRGRGGYCFEHGTLFAAVLERLGYDVTRRLGRVGPPEATARTHCVVVVDDPDGEPASGCSPTRASG